MPSFRAIACTELSAANFLGNEIEVRGKNKQVSFTWRDGKLERAVGRAGQVGLDAPRFRYKTGPRASDWLTRCRVGYLSLEYTRASQFDVDLLAGRSLGPREFR